MAKLTTNIIVLFHVNLLSVKKVAISSTTASPQEMLAIMKASILIVINIFVFIFIYLVTANPTLLPCEL